MKINIALKNKLKKSVLEQLHNPSSREVVVKSPYPLTQTEIATLRTHASLPKQVTLTNEVDTSLIGGLIILDGSRIIDVSIKGRLSEIVNSLLQN